MEGVAGELFKDLSLAVAFSLLASLLVALTLLPSMAARFAGAGSAEAVARASAPVRKRNPGFWGGTRYWASAILRAPGRLARGAGRLVRALVGYWLGGIGRVLARTFNPILRRFDRFFETFARRYHAVLEWALEHPTRVLASTFGVFVVSVALGGLLRRDLLPQVDQGAFQIRLELPEGTALSATADAAAEIERAALADPGVAAIFSNIGRDVRAYAEGEQASGLHTATFQVRVAEHARSDDVAERMRALASRFPPGALSVETGQATALGAMLGGAEADIAVRVRSEDLDQAYAMAGEVERRLEGVSAVGNVRIGTERGQPQIQIEIDRAACAAYGIDPSVVAGTVDRTMRGDLATQFVDFDRKIDVVVRYPDDRRYSLSTLQTLRVEGVPIRELIHVREAVGPAEVHREDQARVVPVYADVVQGGLDAAIASVSEVGAPRKRTSTAEWFSDADARRRSSPRFG